MIEVGSPVPEAAVHAGTTRALAEVIGDDPALLVFFKSSCATSQMALPVYQHWSEQVRVVGISQDDEATTADFLNEYGIDMDIVYDRPDFEASSSFDIDAVPAVALIEDNVVTLTGTGWNRANATELAHEIAERAGSDPLLVGADGLPPFRPG